MRFYLGTCKPHWLGLAGVPLMLSARSLRARKSLPRAVASWALDSGGFVEISTFGRYPVTPEEYADEVRRWSELAGPPDFAATQDWMCEPAVLAKTGLSVERHQVNTVNSFLRLKCLAPEVHWLPVVQGYTVAEYLQCVRLYEGFGVNLAALPRVGLGSVCRRQSSELSTFVSIVAELARAGLRLHAFGVKTTGLRQVAPLLWSADSGAWPKGAYMKRIRLAGHRHRTCANCLEYALLWRQRLLSAKGAGYGEG